MEKFFNIPTPPPRHARTFRKVGRWCLFAAAAITPFFFLPATEAPADINKLVAVGVLAGIAFICSLGCALEERRIEYPRSWLALVLLLFVMAQGISAWFSATPAQSFWGNLAAPDSVIGFIIYFLLFFLFFFFFRREDLKKIAIAVGIGLLAATAAMLVSPVSPSGWGILVAAVLASLAVVRPGRFAGRAKFIFFAVAAVAIAALVILNYQFIWLALAVFVVVVAALRFEPREHFQYAFVLIVIALFFALVGTRLPPFFGIPKDPRPGVAATLAVTQGVLTGSGFLVGSGPATFPLDFDAFRPVSINTTSFWSNYFEQGHDFAATLLATGGLLSFLLFLLIIFLAIQPFLHLQSLDTVIAMVASAVTFILAALFWYPASFAELAILFGLLGILIPENARRVIPFGAFPKGKALSISICILALAAFSLAGIFFIGEQYAAAVLFEQSNVLTAQGNLDQAFVKVNDAIALDRSDEYLRGASQILLSETRTLAASSNPSASAEVPAAVTSAIDAAQSAVFNNQRDPANWGNLGSVYEAVMPVASGADTLAVGSYQNAANLDPSNPQWDVDIARVLIESAALLPATPANNSTIQVKWNNAETILQKAIALKDDYADPRVLLVQLYLQEGNIPQAIQRVQELEQESPLDPGIAFELGYLYYESNQLSQAAQEFQVATILSPGYANALYFLGLIYDQQGMEPQALAQFQKIEALNPNNSQIKMIIANLEAGLPALADGAASSTLSGQAAVAPL